MPKLVENEIILFKVETTYNTDSVPTNTTNAVLVESIKWDNRGARMIDRPAVRSSLGQLKQVYGGSLIGFKFDVEIKGSGAAGTPPEMGALLQACRMAETIVASTSVTYKPSSGANPKSGTMYYYEDGKLWKITGCRGTVTSNLQTGKVGKMSFDIVGHLSGPTDSALVTPTYVATVPPALINVPFSVDSYSAVIEAMSFDLGNTVSMPPSIAAGDGYGEVVVTQRDVKGSINPEAVLVATYDFMNKWKTGAVMSLDTGVIGATAGNRYRATLPAISYRTLSPAERERIRCYQVEFGAAESTTDDELSLIFT